MKRRVELPLPREGQLLELVTQYALDPTCPQCGGPAQLRPGPSRTVDLHVDHREGCELLTER